MQCRSDPAFDSKFLLPGLPGAHAGNRQRQRTGSGRAGDSMMSTPRLVQVRENVFKQNDVRARALRERFRSAGVYVVSLVSSPGAGKTMFLEKTLTELSRLTRVAALVGDLATENDAERLARSTA